jgi:hypothetical protein
VPPLPALDGSNQLWASDETAPQQANVEYGTPMPSMPVVEGAKQQWAGDETMSQQANLEYGQTNYVYVPVPVPIPVMPHSSHAHEFQPQLDVEGDHMQESKESQPGAELHCPSYPVTLITDSEPSSSSFACTEGDEGRLRQ